MYEDRNVEAGETYDEVITIGPLIMMKFVVATTRPFGVKTTVSMNPIMIDGTGMCGGCRLTVGGKTRFACVEGPDFDGFEVDFDEAMERGAMYRDFERHAYEETCNLFAMKVSESSPEGEEDAVLSCEGGEPAKQGSKFKAADEAEAAAKTSGGQCVAAGAKA